MAATCALRFCYPMTPAQEARYQAADLVLSPARARRTPGRSWTTWRRPTWRATWTGCAQAVGDERLNYMGVSYRYLLGVSYANMFPEPRARR